MAGAPNQLSVAFPPSVPCGSTHSPAAQGLLLQESERPTGGARPVRRRPSVAGWHLVAGSP
eukprot:scaffold244920_cov24-Tisochrysis_lutea.AAC.5